LSRKDVAARGDLSAGRRQREHLRPISADGENSAEENGDVVRPIVRTLVTGYPALFREGLRQLLLAAGGLEVVGEATSALATVSMVPLLQPNVVLLDLDMPDSHPTLTPRQLRAASPESRIVILSTHEATWLVNGLDELGVSGYLPKSVSRHELLGAVFSAGDDEHVMLSVSRNGLTRLSGEPGLSVRERDVLSLTAEALSNRQIADRLGISEGTVKRHLRNIFAKLGAVSRIDAVNKAIAASLIPSPYGRGDRHGH
jgi:DNA-binding NarL/FixJ family response regulator